MKICQYCGQVSHDNAVSCSACGASVFRIRCQNCSFEFDDGLYCPKCGVRVGMQEKRCPRCGRQYYSTACPDCGYLPGERNRPSPPPPPVYAPPPPPVYAPPNPVSAHKQKRNTCLWVLGWIFLFPVPLTILLIRNKKMKLWLRISLIVLAWLVYFLIANSNA